jgi:type II secretory pathway component PulF
VPTFIYTARNKAGEKIEGTVEANDRRAVMVQVEKLGLIPVSVKDVAAAPQATAKVKFGLTRNKMSTRDVLIFTTELSDLLASGMTLGNALNCLANRKSGTIGDKIIAELRDEIIRGASLSEAFARHPATFSKLYVSMIKAGETAGAIDEVLRRLVDHFERVQETKEKVVMALVYPMIVLFMGSLTLVFSMVYVIPQFKQIFDNIGQTLPLPTRILIGMSGWLARYGLIAAAFIAVGIVMANRAVKTEKGMFWWHGFLLKTPLIRGIVASSTYANFARTLGTLMANGVPVLQALGIVEKTVDNAVIGKEIRNARERVTDGTTISGPLAAGKVLPTMMTDMLAIGEQTGDMTSALKHIARRYENELDRNIKIFTTALEPILIIFVAIMVGFIAVSVLMAVFSMTNGLGSGG